jgi:hypothetical protein
MATTSYSLEIIAAKFEVPIEFIKLEIRKAKVVAFGAPSDRRISGTELERWSVTRQFEIMMAQKKLRARYEGDTQLSLEFETL